MAQTYSVETAGVDSVPVVKPSAASAFGSHLYRYRATVNLTAQAIGDTVVLADIPAGMIFAHAVVNTNTSLGTATLAIGNASTNNKYVSGSTLTATNSPTPMGNESASSMAYLTAQERVLLTAGVAAFPASGQMTVDLYFSKA